MAGHSRAEIELMQGIHERAAHQQRMVNASAANAANWSAAKSAAPGCRDVAPVYEFPAYSGFSASGYIASNSSVGREEADRRNEFHKAYVLPSRSAREGHVRTGLTANGTTTSALRSVQVAEYFRRYRAWKKWGVNTLVYSLLSSDKEQIRRVTGFRSGFTFWLYSKLGLGRK